MEDRHLSKRVILQPSTSFPVNTSSSRAPFHPTTSGGVSFHTGSATANNEIDAHLYERLQTHPAAVRRRIHAGYTGTAPSSASFSSVDATGKVIFEDEKTFLRRLEDGRAAFARAQSMPVQMRMGEVQPFANSFDTREWEAKMSSPIKKDSNALLEEGAEADATEYEPVLLKRAREGAEGQEEQDRDDVLGKWAEEEDANSSCPSTQDSSHPSSSLGSAGPGDMDTDRRISSLPKRLFAHSKTAHASPFVRPQLPASATGSSASAFAATAAKSTTSSGAGMPGAFQGDRAPMSRTAAASAPVWSRQMQDYLAGMDASAESEGPWQTVGFEKFTNMEEGF